EYNTRSPRQSFSPSCGLRLPNIEKAEQQEGGQISLPIPDRRSGQREPLPEHLIDNDDSRVCLFEVPLRSCRCPNCRPQQNQAEHQDLSRAKFRVLVQQPRDQYAGCGPCRPRTISEIPATEKCRNRKSDPRHSVSPDSSSSSLPFAGEEITYFSDAQLPRSIMRQRSLQKGMFGSSNGTSFLQMGHLTTGVSSPDIHSSKLRPPDYARVSDERRAAGKDLGIEAVGRITKGAAGFTEASGRFSPASMSSPIKS